MKRIFTCITVVAVVFCALFAFGLTAQAASNETLVYSNDFSSGSAGWYQFGTNSGSLSVENEELRMSNHTQAWFSPAYDMYSLLKSYGAGTYWFQISVKYTGDATDTAGAYMNIRGNGSNSFLSNYSGNYLTAISSRIYLQEDVWATFYGSVKILASDFTTAGNSTTMVLCVDGIPYGSNVELFIDDVKIYRMDDTCITNSSFNSGLVGWRPWCNTGDDAIGADMITSYDMFYGRYLRVEKYGSIACNVDQILSYYGPGTYTLSFRMWSAYLGDNSSGNFDVYFSRGTSEYHYRIGGVNLKDNTDLFTFTVNITEEIYNNFRADLNEVFFRLNYSGDVDEQVLYFIDDVVLTPPALPEIKANMTHEDFVDAVYARARRDQNTTKIPAALMTAQACYESGYGTSSAAINKNNILGLMSNGSVRSFTSIDECIKAYERSITTMKCYAHLFNYDVDDVYSWTFGIGPAGYCPEANYGSEVWKLIEQWDLLERW